MLWHKNLLYRPKAYLHHAVGKQACLHGHVHCMCNMKIKHGMVLHSSVKYMWYSLELFCKNNHPLLFLRFRFVR